MPSLNMNGPYRLDEASIDKAVTIKSPGNYALGSYDPNREVFTPKYVGRSDSDVNSRVKSWVGKKQDCNTFKFAYAANARSAFDEECRNFHDFKGIGVKLLDNDIHPDRPNGADWQCPHCDNFKEKMKR